MRVTWRPLARREFTVVLTNPKAMLLFTAFLPQFVDTARPAAGQLLGLGGVYFAVEMVAAGGYAIVGGRLGALHLGERVYRNLDRLTGACCSPLPDCSPPPGGRPPEPRLSSRAVALDLTADPIDLTAALVDVPSVSGAEAPLADAVQAALAAQAPHLTLLRSGNAVLARTDLGRPTRVLLAGHLDTVPIAGNVPSRRDGDVLYGCGTSDMKAGDAVFLHLAATVAEPAHDVTLVFYDCEEVEAVRNGLGRIEREHPSWLAADLAILGEPTGGAVEAGCQGTLRVVVRTRGRRAHSARSWLGRNAIHAAGEVLARLGGYRPRDVEIDGCTYREGLQAVRIDGGVAGNVVPDECAVTVNFRFTPDRSLQAAQQHVLEIFDGFECEFTDGSPGALPGLDAPAARDFLAASGAAPVAKYGWTDVSRFAALGVPALNYGPGDPNLAHTREEHVVVERITAATEVLQRYLTAAPRS